MREDLIRPDGAAMVVSDDMEEASERGYPRTNKQQKGHCENGTKEKFAFEFVDRERLTHINRVDAGWMLYANELTF